MHGGNGAICIGLACSTTAFVGPSSDAFMQGSGSWTNAFTGACGTAASSLCCSNTSSSSSSFIKSTFNCWFTAIFGSGTFMVLGPSIPKINIYACVHAWPNCFASWSRFPLGDGVCTAVPTQMHMYESCMHVACLLQSVFMHVTCLGKQQPKKQQC